MDIKKIYIPPYPLQLKHKYFRLPLKAFKIIKKNPDMMCINNVITL